MKVLIIDLNCDHTNPHFKNYVNAMAKEMEVSFYGPGFSSRETLDRGLENYIAVHGKPDVIIVGNYLLESAIDNNMGNAEMLYFWHRYLIDSYSIYEASRYSKAIIRELKEIHNVIRVVKLIRDYITIPQFLYTYLKDLLEQGFFIIGVGQEFIPKDLGNKKFGETRTTNLQVELVKEYHSQIIPILWLGGLESNFCFSDLATRKYDWNVPGVANNSYPQRVIVREQLRKSEYRLWDEAMIPPELPYKSTRSVRWKYTKCNSIIEKLIYTLDHNATSFIANSLKEEDIAAFREQYQRGLRQSKCAYVEGTNLKGFVNKYFEAPATGTLLVGDIVAGAEQMGFKPNVNMIEATPKSILAVSKKIFADPEYMQEVANNGRKLIIEKHTFTNRARDTKRIFERIQKENYRGSHWENGDLILE